MGRPINSKYFLNTASDSYPAGALTQGISAVTVLTSGTYYSTLTTVVFSAPNAPAGGVQATGTATITVNTASGNGVTKITVTTTGSGYTSTGSVVVTLQNAGTGTGATFLVSLTTATSVPGSLKSIAYIPGGTGAYIADIIKQEGERSFWVQTQDGYGRCSLTATGTSFLTAGQMNMTATDFSSNTYWVSKIANRKALVYQNALVTGTFLVSNGVKTGWTTGTSTGTIVAIAHY